MVKLRKMKKVWSAILLLTAVFSLAACGTTGSTGGSGDGQESADYVSITAEEAKGMMDAEQDYIILDVRTEEEFAEGHIPGAVLIPDYEIGDRSSGSASGQRATHFRLLPQWKPQQKSVCSAGGDGIYKCERIRRHHRLAV